MNHDKDNVSYGVLRKKRKVKMLSHQPSRVTRQSFFFLLLICFCTISLTITECSTRPDDLPRLMKRDYERIEDLSKIVQMQDPNPWIDFRQPNSLLSQILIPRVPQSKGNAKVREALLAPFRKNSNWTIEEHKFRAHTPEGEKMMTNLIITYNIDAPRKLVLAAHHDSKLTPTGFIGATDSAAPCAIIVDAALAIGKLLDSQTSSHERGQQTGLQLLLFDGEEAYHQWTGTDSLYGSRALADEWSKTFFSPKLNKRRLTPGYHTMRMIDSIDHFILLDLLGSPKPHVPPYFGSTKWMWDEIVNVESRLAKAGLLYPKDERGKFQLPPPGNSLSPMLKIGDGNEERPSFFSEFHVGFGGIDDDHRPFLHQGVPIVHLIASPFPTVWHTMGDDASALDYPTIYAWTMILRVVLAEYFGLKVEESSKINKKDNSFDSLLITRNGEEFVSKMVDLSSKQGINSLNISDHSSFFL